nr:hypothetical protein [Tanacetum cinerariifolium]
MLPPIPEFEARFPDICEMVAFGWGRGANMPVGNKWFFVCATDGDGTIYVAGGYDVMKNPLIQLVHIMCQQTLGHNYLTWHKSVLLRSDDYDKIIKSPKYCGQGPDLKLYTHSANDIVVLEDGN